MGRFTEEEATKIALKIIGDNPGCTTEYLMHQIEEEYVFSPEDLEPLANRKDKKYSQIIRNLTSHFETNEFGRHVIRIKEGRIWKYTLKTADRQVYRKNEFDKLAEMIEDYKEFLDVTKETEGYSASEVEAASNRVPQLDETQSTNHRYKTDPKLAKTALINAELKCELEGIVTNRNHKTFKSKKSENYTEAHHLIPMKAQKDFGSKNLDRIENIVSLCPTCHRAVHFGTRSEKLKYLKPLYEKRIQLLRECSDHIDITFEDLVNKYY